MTDTVRTPLAEWRKRDDGSWEPVAYPPSVSDLKNVNVTGPHPTVEIQGGDNVLVTTLPDGSILIERGGHAILYSGVESPWRPAIDFTGAGVDVSDDGINGRTVVTIPGVSTAGVMRWRGEWDDDAIYTPGDVVAFEDALFVFDDVDIPPGFGYGYGPYGGGPYGAAPVGGFGSAPYGYGPYGG